MDLVTFLQSVLLTIIWRTNGEQIMKSKNLHKGIRIAAIMIIVTLVLGSPLRADFTLTWEGQGTHRVLTGSLPPCHWAQLIIWNDSSNQWDTLRNWPWDNGPWGTDWTITETISGIGDYADNNGYIYVQVWGWGYARGTYRKVVDVHTDFVQLQYMGNSVPLHRVVYKNDDPQYPQLEGASAVWSYPEFSSAQYSAIATSDDNRATTQALNCGNGTIEPEDRSVCDRSQQVFIFQVIPVFVDIKPQSCPNPLNLKSKGVLPVAVLGTEDFDVTQIDPATVGLSREGVEDGDGNPIIVSPLRWAYEDVATPFKGDLCDCHTLGPDGYLDLTLKFDVPELVAKLKLDEVAGETIPLTLTGSLKEELSGTPIRGEDCISVLKEKGPQKP
jgi:hypothetical protein